MSNYTFTFKKGNIIAEFTTTDKLAVERQFPLWVANADEAAKKMASAQAEEKKSPEHRPPVVESPVPEQVEEPAFVAPEIVEESFAKDSLDSGSENKNDSEISQVAEEPAQAAANAENFEAESQENSQVFDKASDLLKTINTIQNPVEEPPIEEVVVDFERVLEQSIENPTFEPNQTKDDRFLSVVASKNTSDRFHYLIITAYYLLEYEKMDRFSLKQINAKLMNNLSRVVDHTILREAINQDFIEIVPELTGASEAAEYRLTGRGEEFFFNGIN